MNNKNLVALSENELENISGGVNKKALGDAVEYGIATAMMFPFGLVGKILSTAVFVGMEEKDDINKVADSLKDFFANSENSSSYIPVYGVGGENIKEAVTDQAPAFAVSGTIIVVSELGAMTGGWFAGRALGKKLRKKLGL